MKRYTLLWVTAFSLLSGLSACSDHTDSETTTTTTDSTMMTTPPETETAPANSPDTVSVPPVDPSMDTAGHHDMQQPR